MSGCGRQSNAPAARASDTAPVLVAIAASDAVGIGAANPDRDNWVAQLGTRLPAHGRVVNLGISGATAAQAAQQELPVALDAAPTLAVVWLGVNDIDQQVTEGDFVQNLNRIITALNTVSGSHVYVGNIPDLRLLSAFRDREPATLDAQVAAWNANIARIVRDNGAHLVDIHSSWQASKDREALVSGDGLHPTTAGYARLAELFWQAIHGTG
jgi:lysophospholipase L1-like esterase